MFTYRCPGCGKQHVVQTAFEKDYSTPCLRCGEMIAVSRATIRRPTDESITAKPGKGTADAEAAAEADAEAVTTEAADSENAVPLADGVPAAGAAGRNGAARRRQSRNGRPRGTAVAEGDDAEGQAEEGAADAASATATAESDRPSEDDGTKPPPKADDAPKWYQSWPAIAGATVVVLTLIGVGVYFIWFRGSSQPSASVSQTPAKPKPKSTAPATTARSSEKEKKEEKPAGPKPAALPKGPEIHRISAARLAAELAANPAATNAKYKETILEVCGVFDKIENKESVHPPSRPHALFAAEGAAIACDLFAAPTELGRWKRLRIQEVIGVRGTYSSDGFLHGCELLSPPPVPADVQFKGQEVEVAGTVNTIFLPPTRPFPTLTLDSDTDSQTTVECRFELPAEGEVKKYAPSTPVIIHGKCAGRLGKPGAYIVQLENCQIVYTSSPTPPAVRLPVVALLRAYEEDLRTFVLPPPGAEEQVAEPLTLSQLNKEWSADPKKMDAKYRNKVITLSGLSPRKSGDGVVLVSGKTDEALKVHCRFDRLSLQDLKGGPDYRIRGRWSRMEDAGTVRLESCMPGDVVARDQRRIVADYLPHPVGQRLTYDVAMFPLTGKNTIQRIVLLQRDEGLTESLITHEGMYGGKSLFDDPESDKWIAQKKAVTIHQPGQTGPTFLQRISGNFVELGQITLGRDGRRQTIWEPILKLNARAGDSWKWTDGNLTHEYSIEAFGERGGRSSVIVKEIVSNLADPMHPTEMRHVYVRDVGRVELRVWLRVTSKDRRLIRETKLVESEPPKKPPSKP